MTYDSLTELQGLLDSFVTRRNWSKWHRPKNLALALAGEVGELCQLYRWTDDVDSALVKDELADIGIFLFHLCRVLDVDLASAMRTKIAINEKRFPEGI